MLTRRVAAGHWIPFQTSTTIRCNQVVSLTSQQMATYRHHKQVCENEDRGQQAQSECYCANFEPQRAESKPKVSFP